MNDRPKFLTADQVVTLCKTFGIKLSKSTLSHLRCREGSGPKFTKRFCNRVLYREDHVMAWIFKEDA